MIGINIGLNLGSRIGGLVQAVVETFTYFGGEISYTVDGVNGQYADGSYWTTGSVTDMAPAFATGVTRTLEDTSTVAGTEVHGWMVNPGNAALYKGGDVSTLALRQAANFGTGSNMEPQAYDSFTGSNNLAYDAANRVALPLTSGTVIKAKSQIAGVDNNARPALEYNAALTIVSSAPAAGSIRPPIAAESKTSVLNTSTLNLALLRNLDVSGFVNSLPGYSEALEWLAQLTTFESCYNVLSRNIIADNGTALSPYHGDISLQWSQIVLAMHTNAYTVPQKEALAIQFGMISGDIAARVNEGGVFQANGGHSAGRLPIVAFAAELFNSTYLRDACEVLAEATITNVVTAGQSVYGDLGQLHYVTQSMIDASVGELHPFPQAMLGYPSWSSQYAVDPATRVAGNIMGNSLVEDNTGVTNSASYQSIVAKAMVGHSLSLRLLQGVTANVPLLYHDYTDRWVGFEANDDYVFLEGAIVKSGSNLTPDWVLEAYTAFSPLVTVWTPPATYTENVVDNQRTAHFTQTSGNALANSATYSLAARFTLQDNGITSRLTKVSGRSEIGFVADELTILLKDSANATLLNTTTSGLALLTGVEYFLEVFVDLASGGNGSISVTLDGVPVSMPALGANNGLISGGRATGILATDSGALNIDAHISELFLSTINLSAGTLWNGGTKDNLATLAGATPEIYFGNGQAAAAWNAGTNLGSGTVTAVGTFLDV